MVRFYGIRIKNGVINPKAGEPWKLADVPHLWRDDVAEWLKNNP